jgi:hypothetical protein
VGEATYSSVAHSIDSIPLNLAASRSGRARAMVDSTTTHRLELLDADYHHALQAWPLEAVRGLVSLGRARTNDIVIASPTWRSWGARACS